MAKRKNRRRRPRTVNLSEVAAKGNKTSERQSSFPWYISGVFQKQTPRKSITAPSSSPSLADRFHALPAELRIQIFSLLLVRPVKWELSHRLGCPLIKANDWIKPKLNPNVYPPDPETCVRCVTHHWAQLSPLWRREEPVLRKTWINPWRSEWAPPVQNEFMCSDCWDEDFRAGCTWPSRHPAGPTAKRNLRCLCARREDLSVLLVCRKWYQEAASVFYSGNVFAFEDGGEFYDFVDNLDERWRGTIKKVSLVAWDNWPVGGSFIWSRLRQLPSLSYLELDAQFLTQVRTVQKLLRLGLTGVKRLFFSVRNPKRSYETTLSGGTPYVYPEFYQPTLLSGGFAEEVARAIKGQRRPWLKRRGALQRAARREQKLQTLMITARQPYACRDAKSAGGNYDCRREICYKSDLEEWERLWETVGCVNSYLLAPRGVLQPPLYVHWRERNRMERSFTQEQR